MHRLTGSPGQRLSRRSSKSESLTFVVSIRASKISSVRSFSSGNGPGGTINHLGVQVGSAGEVTQAEARLAAEGLAVAPEPDATCCYARQDKVWAHDPDGVAWEYYTVLEHIETS